MALKSNRDNEPVIGVPLLVVWGNSYVRLERAELPVAGFLYARSPERDHMKSLKILHYCISFSIVIFALSTLVGSVIVPRLQAKDLKRCIELVGERSQAVEGLLSAIQDPTKGTKYEKVRTVYMCVILYGNHGSVPEIVP